MNAENRALENKDQPLSLLATNQNKFNAPDKKPMPHPLTTMFADPAKMHILDFLEDNTYDWLQQTQQLRQIAPSSEMTASTDASVKKRLGANYQGGILARPARI